MRDLFREYYRPSEEEFAQLWQDATFVFDTNVLLHFYRYTASTRDDLLRNIESLQQRIWLPHQVGLEFSRSRVGVIADQNAIFALINVFDVFVKEKFIKDIVQKCGKRGHYFADLDKIQAIFEQTKQALQDELQRARAQYPDPMEDDFLLERLDELFQGKIGAPYSKEQMAELSSEFEERYKHDVPPGFKDKNKKPKTQEESNKPTTQNDDSDNPANRYGDVIIWYQIIEYAKREKRPIILVVDDVKEDWWQQLHGKTIGPKPELRHEIQEKADVPFYMYNFDNFIQKARDYLKLPVLKETIEEVRESRLQEEKQREDLISTYPSESLFPSSVLYPSAEIIKAVINQAQIQEQYTRSISGLAELNRQMLEQKQWYERLASPLAAIYKDEVIQAAVYKDDRLDQTVVYKDDILDGNNS